MANFDSQFRIEATPSDPNNLTTSWSGKINDKTVTSGSSVAGSRSNLIHLNVPEFGISKLTFDIDLEILGASSATFNLRVITHSTHEIKQAVNRTVTALGKHHLELYFQGRHMQNAPPTYLEELHKLDNFTKAQYIP